jgi:hypothetical protein
MDNGNSFTCSQDDFNECRAVPLGRVDSNLIRSEVLESGYNG